jgi:hypothetical protein
LACTRQSLKKFVSVVDNRCGRKMDCLHTKAASASEHPPVRKSERKVVLLDFDGVLHRGDAYRTRHGIVSSDPSRIKLFEYAGLLAAALKPYPDVEIVLSTTWVEALGFNRARDALPEKALRDRVVGATYHSRYYDALRWSEIARGHQVLRYVRGHRLLTWLAIDDRLDGFETVRDRLVLCDPDKGLGDPDTQGAFASALRKFFGCDAPTMGDFGDD